MEFPKQLTKILWKPFVVMAAIAFLFANVIKNLTRDWWSDENYSHGLLVPFVIAIIIYLEFDELKKAIGKTSTILGAALIACGALLLLLGTLGAELFTQRIALVTVILGVIGFFFGLRIFKLLITPFLLLLFAIPIPQIVFNKIALPLQIFASRVAVFGIRLFDIATVRKGNVIELLPQGATQFVSLEVVEACSGIRSLMTLATLALVLAYFTRTKKCDANSTWKKVLLGADSFRATLLVLAAIPIAVLTNAARVTATGVITFYFGRQAAEGFVHSFSGWLVYLVALALLFLLNILLKRILPVSNSSTPKSEIGLSARAVSAGKVLVVALALFAGGIAITWIDQRGEVAVARKELRLLPATLGKWRQQGNDIRFGESTESILKATDYVMRDYFSPTVMHANIYVGYYSTQRTGATYHSPQNCLPGAGWEMTQPEKVQITKPDGESFEANRFILVTGNRREVLIYWYQGRGRKTASEYEDKLNTVFDSFLRRRTDGAMVRVITTVRNSDEASEAAALDIASHLAVEISPFVPE